MSCDRMRSTTTLDDTMEGSSNRSIERPSTAHSTHTKSKLQTQQKSFIPTFKSLSQPPNMVQTEGSLKLTLDCTSKLADSCSLMESELLTDINAISDEFKDCLESVKLDFDCDNTELDSLQLGNETAEQILNNLKTPDELEPLEPPRCSPKSRDISPKLRSMSRNSVPLRNLSRKNSNSGIPVSMSLSKNGGSKTPTPRPILRRGSLSPNGHLVSKRAPSQPGSPEKPSPVPNAFIKRNMDTFLTKKRRYDTLRREVQIKQKPLLDLHNALQQLKFKLAELGEQVSFDPLEQFPGELRPNLNLVEVCIGPNEGDLIEVNLGLLDEVRQSADVLRRNSTELCRSMLDKRNVLLSSFESLARVEKNSMMLQELELHRNENIALNTILSEAIDEQEADLTDMIKKMDQLKFVTYPPVGMAPPFAEQQPRQQPQQMDVSVSQPTFELPEPAVDLSKELEERTRELEASYSRIKQLEKKMFQIQNDLKQAQAVTIAGRESGDALRTENDKLKHKISVLEKLIETEKRKAQHEVDRLKTTELSSKTLRGKVKELESVKVQNEAKISTLITEIRTTQNKLKLAEKNFEKELCELNKARNLDKAVIERLNRDKSTFETRLSEINMQAEEARTDFVERDHRQRTEMETMRQELDVQTSTVLQLRVECEKLQNELNAIHMHAQQTSELLRKNDDGYAMITERECELQIEVVAQRAAMKALQEKVDSNAMEKIRFIETIENMNGSTNEMRDDIVKTLVQKEEEITQLHQLLKKRDDDLCNRRIEVQNLKAKVDNLQEHIEAMKEEESDVDLRNMIKEGRTKLEEALVKSLESEHKVIKYEHELAQKLQMIAHLENTLKLRDGLIGVLKSKKEELVMENKSLNKYSEEIRSFVIETKEELREKNEIITQLQATIDTSQRDILKYEHRLRDMETQLAMTNEKRYKLQDTVSQMERALQSRSGDDVEIRYGRHHLQLHHSNPQVQLLHFAATNAAAAAAGDHAEGGETNGDGDCNCDCDCSCDCECEEDPECTTAFYLAHTDPIDGGDAYEQAEDEVSPPPVGLQPWHVASAQLFNEYRSAYKDRRPSCGAVVHSQSLGSISARLNISQEPAAAATGAAERVVVDGEECDHGCSFSSTGNAGDFSDDIPMWPEHPSWQGLNMNEGSPARGQAEAQPNRRFADREHDPTAEADDADHHSQGQYYTPIGTAENGILGGGQQFSPMTFSRVDTYQVADSGRVVWLAPSATMQTNNAIITRQEINFSNIRDDGPVKIEITVSN